MKDYTLFDMFESHGGRQIDKWLHYFPIYEKHFERFRGKSPRVLELGVDHGGSLQLWKRYFGVGAEIFGIDINSDSLFSEPQIFTMRYDQTDPGIARHGPFDIVIDDGSHVAEHQMASFDILWPRCTGVYLIEDCHNVQPAVRSVGALKYSYPWVYVYERPKRLIRGTPSRELREDEADARKLYGP
jgi:SAM-dependent methyltransferase